MKEGSSVGYQRRDYVNSLVNEKCCSHIRKQGCYSYQVTTASPETVKPSVTAAMPTVHPEGTQDGKEQGTGPR